MAMICRALDLRFVVGGESERSALPLDTSTHQWSDRRGKEVTPYPVPKRSELQKVRTGFSPNGCAYFGLDFLLDFDLNPKLCEVIEIFDDSMGPEFPAGAAGLVDLRRTERVDGRVYALGCPGLTVRRCRKTPSCWAAVPDNPEFASTPWRDDFEIVGQLVWTSHMVDVELAVRSAEAPLPVCE
ncbi:MAG: hypothetical protein F4Y03_09405 [Alphaproteobacteria bacterium]|nr:hypothetical protein [Alphaproteobacteria bacterium]